MSLVADWHLSGPLLCLWPFRDDVWREHGVPAQRQLLALWEQLSPHYPILFGVRPELFKAVRQQLPSELALFSTRYNDAWPRDIGPLWCYSDRTQITAHTFSFSAWHGLYPDYRDDQKFADNLAAQLQVKRISHQLVFEGGAIATDGDGTAVVHGVSVARNNPTRTRQQIHQQLLEQLGLQQIFWLDFAHPADETGGHTDNQVQFLDANTIVVSMPEVTSPWYADYQRQLQQVGGWCNRQGLAYRVVVLPQPEALQPIPHEYSSVRHEAGVFPRGRSPLLASYVNFVRAGEHLVVPQFGLDSDQDALQILKTHAPHLNVIAAPADEFIKAGGALHCMTLQLPAVAKALL